MSRDNVIVVGAGPTGLVTALGLARAGVDVTVVEREPAIVKSPRAVVYHWAVLDGLDRVGILEDAIRAGFTNPELCIIVLKTGEKIRLNINALAGEVTHPYQVHLGQDRLAEIALGHLLRFPHARVRWGTRVRDLEQDTDGVTLRADSAEGDVELRCGWVVGADGGSSTVRQLVGLAMDGMTWPERFVATNIRYDFAKYGYAPANVVIDAPYGAIVAKIDDRGLWRCTYCEDDSLPEQTILERMPAYFNAALPGSKAYELVEYSPYRMHQRCAERMRVGRVVLAGDAAHITNPTGGLGLTSGLYDAYVLYDALAAVIRGEVADEVLDRYSDERRRAFLEHASPEASNFKRMVYHSKTDAELEAQLAGFREAARDQSLQRLIFLTAKKLETPPLVPRAR
jgi:6-hydroxy-3-succinoylpyridine 3-monooxygenase